jgi:peptide/nickel transport system substrate-binding protein
MFDSLTTRDKDLNVVPQLAESWKPLDDTTWEFKLRRGVKFHNGDDLTSKDVKFTLDRVTREGALDGKTSPRKGLLASFSGVTIVDDFTIRIQTTKP